MIKVNVEFEKISDVLSAVNTVTHTVQTSANMNQLMKSANTLLTSEFVMHMSRAAIANPSSFSHMYDWKGIGDPNARLWTHKMRGRGSNRELTFDFKASKRSVPISPLLQSKGVKRSHVFVWKAPILELGLPVRITQKLAKVLVFEEKEVKNPARSTGKGYVSSGAVYYDGLIHIERQGSPLAWGAFTREFLQWFQSEKPDQILKESLTKKIERTVKNSVDAKMQSISKKKSKTFTMYPVGIDEGFQKKLDESLQRDYSQIANTRRLITDE